MKSLNRVQELGHVAADPVVRFLPSGTQTANFTVATNKRWRDKQSGELKESTTYIRNVAFGPLADLASKYVKKGSHVMVEGEIQNRDYTGQDGVKRYVTEVRLSQIILLDKKNGNGSDDAGAENEPEAGAEHGASDEDIPF